MESFILLFLDKREELSELFIQHMNMTAIAVFISLMIGVPLALSLLNISVLQIL